MCCIATLYHINKKQGSENLVLYGGTRAPQLPSHNSFENPTYQHYPDFDGVTAAISSPTRGPGPAVPPRNPDAGQALYSTAPVARMDPGPSRSGAGVSTQSHSLTSPTSQPQSDYLQVNNEHAAPEDATNAGMAGTTEQFHSR